MRWISKFGDVASRVALRTVPDPFVIAVLLAVGVSLTAVFVGRRPDAAVDAIRAAAPAAHGTTEAPTSEASALAAPEELTFPQALKSRTVQMFEAWHAPSGMWSLLLFSMQMTLILVLGYALTEAPLIQGFLHNVAGAPRSTASAVHMISFISCMAALVHWGLSLIIGATLARRTAIAGLHHGRKFHYPLLGAAGYSGLMIWHSGLTGSGPLELANAESQLASSVPGGAIDLGSTVLSDLNLVVAACAVILIPYVFRWLAPKVDDESHTVDKYLPAEEIFPATTSRTRERTLMRRVEQSKVLKFAFFVILAVGLFVTVRRQSVSAINWLNVVNSMFFALAILLHRDLRSFRSSAMSAVRGAAGIVVQFPIYAGIASVMVTAGFVDAITSLCALLPPHLFPIAAFLDTCLLKLFIPSGGGKFLVQGPRIAQLSAEFAPQGHFLPHTWVMALAYGDQLMNMIQPFWALALLGITGLRARHIMGYCFVAMLLVAPLFIAALWVMG